MMGLVELQKVIRDNAASIGKLDPRGKEEFCRGCYKEEAECQKCIWFTERWVSVDVVDSLVTQAFSEYRKQLTELSFGKEPSLRKRLEDPILLEKLAELEHEQWAEFVQYLIGFGEIHGEITAKEFWRNYDTLSKTPYSNLTEKQKESDRKFAKKVLAVFGEAFSVKGFSEGSNGKKKEKTK